MRKILTNYLLFYQDTDGANDVKKLPPSPAIIYCGKQIQHGIVFLVPFVSY